MGPWGSRATGTLDWGGTGVGWSLCLTWTESSFLDGSPESHGGAGRAGQLTQDLRAVLGRCSGLADTGCIGREAP